MIERLAASLPEAFEFYHLGSVQPARAPGTVPPQKMLATSLAAHAKVGYLIHGDVTGALIIAFERGLDLSTYMEMGNVIASRMVTAFVEGTEPKLDAMISPPQALGERALERLLDVARPEEITMKVYVHRHEGRVHAVYAFLVPAASHGNSPGPGTIDA
ncbi:MAG TPA: hypothetical protein VM598_12005 [Bdellovibrionota bacterium]|jgi:hypothetical protein|nr:hypothetical protein [Bdellovibrionota bacterium]